MTGAATGRDFEGFVEETEERLRSALISRFGPDRGREAAAEAFAYAWEHWDRIATMDNPAGYLYRVGQHAAARRQHPPPLFPEVPHHSEPIVEPRLPAALASLTTKQRTAVMLIHGFGWHLEEAAGVLGVSVSSLRTHLLRGMAKLRTAIGGDSQ